MASFRCHPSSPPELPECVCHPLQGSQRRSPTSRRPSFRRLRGASLSCAALSRCSVSGTQASASRPGSSRSSCPGHLQVSREGGFDVCPPHPLRQRSINLLLALRLGVARPSSLADTLAHATVLSPPSLLSGPLSVSSPLTPPLYLLSVSTRSILPCRRGSEQLDHKHTDLCPRRQPPPQQGPFHGPDHDRLLDRRHSG